MIVTDLSGLPLPGKEADVIALAKEIVAHCDRHWPLAVPRRVFVDVEGEAGRIRLIAVKESQAEHERQRAAQDADATLSAMYEKIRALVVADSVQFTLRRAV